MKESEQGLAIAAVEREVGVSKDVLRVWERRYGFPRPLRTGTGERLYPPEQVRRLVLVKRLMDRGHRPGKLLQSSLEDLQARAADVAPPAGEAGTAAGTEVADLVRLLRARDTQALGEALQQRLSRAGLERFVLDTAAPAAVQVGLQWACGELQIHEEHLFTELLQRLLRQAVAQLPPGRSPVVLLTTVPDEPHGLGLVMLEALLALQGARCVNLGPQLPLLEIARAAGDHQAHVVALSFSAAFPARQVTPVVQQLRAALDAGRQLWVGGAGAKRLGETAGVLRLDSFEAAMEAVAAWPDTAGH